MKVTTDNSSQLPPNYHYYYSDLNKPNRRKPQRNPSFTRFKRLGPPKRSRTRPETPLLKWKLEDNNNNNHNKVKKKNNNASPPVSVAPQIDYNDDEEEEEAGEVVDSRRRRRRRKDSISVVSSRKLAAGLWRMHQPEMVAGGGCERRKDRLGFQHGAGHVGFPFLFECSNGKAFGSESKDLLQSPSPRNGATNAFFRKIEPSMQFPNSAMEGTTKWNPIRFNPTEEVHRIYSNNVKRIDQQVSALSMVSALETELERARARIEELETERRTSKKKLEHFLRKVSEERAAWRSREHEKIRAVIDDIKTELSRERKSRQRTEIVNSKLVNELADAKLTAKRFMQDHDKERKARELIEEVCDELAKEIGEDKAEVEALKQESMKLRDEVEEERKMLQMVEVWREERVQMKLVDAKVALDEKYSQMNFLVGELEKFLKSRNVDLSMEDSRMAELLHKAATNIDIQEVKEFSYEPSNSDDIYAVFEEMNFGDPNEREIEPCSTYSPASKIHAVSPEDHTTKKKNNQRCSNIYNDGEIDDDESGWETVSHIEDQGSSYSPEGSAPSVSKNCRNSRSGTESYEETPITEISEVCSIPRQKKKGSSIARLWRSVPNNGENYKIISLENGRLSNGRLSNGRLSTNTGISSPDREGLSPDLVGQWSSPESGNPHITRGMKGCIEWPLGAQKNSLKAKLLEARMESQKIQLRHVLKHKI